MGVARGWSIPWRTVQVVEGGWFLPFSGWWRALGTILVGPQVSGQKICHFLEGPQGSGPPSRGGTMALATLGPCGPAHCPLQPQALGHPGWPLGGSVSQDTWQGSTRDAPACPARGQRHPGLMRSPSRWSAQDPAVLPWGPSGQGSAWALGIFLIWVITAPPSYTQSRTLTHAHPHTCATPPSHTLCTRTGRGREQVRVWLQRHQILSWECRDCDLSFCFFPSQQPTPGGSWRGS